MPFEKINPQTDFAKIESILEFWKKENIFYRSIFVTGIGAIFIGRD